MKNRLENIAIVNGSWAMGHLRPQNQLEVVHVHVLFSDCEISQSFQY